MMCQQLGHRVVKRPLRVRFSGTDRFSGTTTVRSTSQGACERSGSVATESSGALLSMSLPVADATDGTASSSAKAVVTATNLCMGHGLGLSWRTRINQSRDAT